MGEQVNFFMSGGDEKLFVSKVSALRGVVIPHRCPDRVVSVYDELPGMDEPYWNELNLVSCSHLAEVRLGNEPVLGYFLTDEDLSPIIQFHRSRRDNQTLYPGRIWATMQAVRWCPEERREVLIDKGEDFAGFYRRLARWIRRTFQRDPEFGFYCGPQAWEWHMSGGRLSLLT